MKRINVSFYLLVLLSLVVFSILAAFTYKAAPLFTTNTLFFCQKTIIGAMREIPRLLPDTLVLLLGSVMGMGILSMVIQLIKTHLFLRKALEKRVSLPAYLTKLSKRLGLENKVVLVKDRAKFSFCAGLLAPYIVISAGLIKSLTNKEIEAVLLHEQSHLAGLDPAKLLVGKTLSTMFFFLPIFGELHKQTEAANELLADQWTIERQKKSTYLRCALRKLLAAPEFNLVGIASLSSTDYFEIRVRKLAGQTAASSLRLSVFSLFSTVLFMLASFVLLKTPVDAFHTNILNAEEQLCVQQCQSVHESTENMLMYPSPPDSRCESHYPH